MTFGELVQQLQQGNDSLYLTTQETGVDAAGLPNIMAPPVSRLRQDFPVRPECMGCLIPQQINLWMGAARNGASSGLHHDFHDNLYILLRGRKRFRLYPPSEAPHMYTHGHLKKIYPNGRIVYAGQGMVLEDGSDTSEVRRWQQEQAVEAELAAAEEGVTAGAKGAKGRLARAEQAFEALLDAQLRCRQHDPGEDGCSGSEGFPADLQDDYIDSDADDIDSNDSQQAVLSLQSRLNPGQACEGLGLGVQQGASRSPTTKQLVWESVIDDSNPPSFSQVDLSSLTETELCMQFPMFPAASKCYECELSAGEQLYLPCGWFHEVRSYGDSQQGGHLALNYWFHPPDNLDPSLEAMQSPYRSKYWSDLWTRRGMVLS
ncbi:hypothetical protein ABBQ32_008175 [Trebouxia sp. C0010 RCD-2024]